VAFAPLSGSLIEETFMQDLPWIAVTIGFFAVAIAYVHFCDRVK
jgi:hypothetical protein